MSVVVTEGNLLDQDVDVIVNTWNRNIIPWWLLLPQGVSGAIKKKAGLKPFWELPRFKPIPLGGAVITSAGRLPYKAIIHVAGINMFWRATKDSIQDSVTNALQIAQQHGFKSIAFPVIGAGSGGFKLDEALQLMREAMHTLSTPLHIIIVKFKPYNERPPS